MMHAFRAVPVLVPAAQDLGTASDTSNAHNDFVVDGGQQYLQDSMTLSIQGLPNDKAMVPKRSILCHEVCKTPKAAWCISHSPTARGQLQEQGYSSKEGILCFVEQNTWTPCSLILINNGSKVGCAASRTECSFGQDQGNPRIDRHGQ